MALNITLNIYDKSNNHLGRHYLYFGKALRRSSWQEWEWIKDQGFTVDGPWAFDEGNEQKNYAVSKKQLSEWIEKGYLSPDSSGQDSSSCFMDSYPEDSVCLLNFMDWS